MAYGEFTVSGDDVIEALTYRDRVTYRRELSNDGETLADLIAEHVFKKIQDKRSATNIEAEPVVVAPVFIVEPEDDIPY